MSSKTTTTNLTSSQSYIVAVDDALNIPTKPSAPDLVSTTFKPFDITPVETASNPKASPNGRLKSDPYISTERPFDVHVNDWGEYNISMESVYGIALIGQCVASSEDFTIHKCPRSIPIYWAIFNQCHLMLILNYIAQFTCIYYLNVFVVIAGGSALIRMDLGPEAVQVDASVVAKTCMVDSFLRRICLSLFLSAVLGEIAETCSMMQWLMLTKTEPNHKQIEVSTTASGDVHLTSGFTKGHKICQIITILLPKLLIGFLVMLYGSAFIVLSASNEDAFLNTLAAVFIVEIDELLHKAYASAIVKKALVNLPPIRTHLRPKIVAFDLTMSNLVLFAVVLLIGGWTEDRYCSARDLEILADKNSTL